MSAANLAYTAPINPDGVKPLTQEQVWEGLKLKVRDAHQFVAAIKSTRVIDEGLSTAERFPGAIPGTAFISREAQFEPGQGPPDAAKNDYKIIEHCFLYEPNRVDFVAPNGNYVSNVVSVGPEGRARASDGADDLYLTYAFSWIAPDGDDLNARRTIMEKGAKDAVDHSIISLRELVEKGVIKA